MTFSKLLKGVSAVLTALVALSVSGVAINAWLIRQHSGQALHALPETFSLLPPILSTVTLSVLLLILSTKKNENNLLYEIAYTDELTGIGNAKMFYSQTSQRLQNKGKNQYAVIYFDIDNFKIINDTFGYEFGDQVLRQVANILCGQLGKQDLCSRFSNDYFAVLRLYQDVEQDVIHLVEQLRDRMINMPIPGRSHIDIPISFGIYLIREDETNVNKVINKANMARSSAKSQLITKYAFFDSETRTRLHNEMNLEQDLKQAIEERKLEVYYQPKYSLRDGKLSGMEALVRWNHPVHGFISPAKFIPLAEKRGLVVEIGRFVFEEVCKSMQEWKQFCRAPVTVCVNLSRVELYQADLMDFFKRTIDKYGIPANQIDIELTETAAISDLNFIRGVITQLKELGFSVAIDDFGTGYSSLSCLKSIPIDVLKLDRSFLQDIEHDRRTANIVSSVINLAKSLDFIVVAEGVETKEQSDFLGLLGCDVAQGFYFAYPMPKQNIAELLKKAPFSMNHYLQEKEQRKEELQPFRFFSGAQTYRPSVSPKDFIINFLNLLFYERSSEKCLACLSPEITWMGTGTGELYYGLEQAQQMLHLTIEQAPASCLLDHMDIKEVWSKNALTLVVGSFSLTTTRKGLTQEMRDIRISALCESSVQGISVSHIHISCPDMYQPQEAYLPDKDIQLLEQLAKDCDCEMSTQYADAFKKLHSKLLQHSVALQNHNEKLSEMISSDELTGLFNHRHMNACIQENLQEYADTGTPFSLILLDLDDFRNINHQFGHQTGDRVLRGVAEVIRDSVRHIGICGRYGGDEFLILLPGTLEQEAQQAAQLIQENVQQGYYTEYLLNLTASAGVAQSRNGMDLNGMLCAVDDNLCYNKAMGKQVATV